jgi:hypothetical protein
MGACLSKPAPVPDGGVKSAQGDQYKPQTQAAAVQETRQEARPAPAAGDAPSIDILPAPPSVAPSVAILPPWVSHNDSDINRRASSSAAVSTANTSNPAANALRSNLSEVRSTRWRWWSWGFTGCVGISMIGTCMWHSSVAQQYIWSDLYLAAPAQQVRAPLGQSWCRVSLGCNRDVMGVPGDMGDSRTTHIINQYCGIACPRVSARVSLLLLLSYAGQVCAAATDSHEPKPNDRSGRGCRDALQALGCGACQVNSVSRVN